MASNSNSSRPPRKNNRNRNYKGRKKTSQTISYTGPAVSCSLCEKNIRDLSSAIKERDSGLPAHFDCIIKKIAENETLKEQEKIVYLGSGKFAVIQTENNQNKNFKIVREIEYEEKEEDPPEWRGSLKKEIL
ncbi:hypothetical protein EXM22_05865 [Oceanispirochaeta crateris]|uniref:Uncharacterized protein n=1 Tax=Oceanispirochaeta crateris TaxID=2518645 RepID=A0A5C1QJ92_9SPIO|nr:hypothetical protein [Oceanispirochaeta crateris]QEN07537.1 hypothetical protein EXM22_05865 [Oceanispirochaeta crateris]